MWFVKNNKKTIDIYPVEEHFCKYNNENSIVKVYTIQDGSKPVLHINLSKNNSVKIDINNCPFCGQELTSSTQ